MSYQTKFSHPELLPHWLLCATLLLFLAAYNIFCQVWGMDTRITLDESQRVMLRSILYAASIIIFPLVKLLRAVLLRLNQTMPGHNPAQSRYFLTIAVTTVSIESVGLFGFLMFMLGDDFNTLYIFSLLAVLGIYLHKPNLHEYLAIRAALEVNKADN